MKSRTDTTNDLSDLVRKRLSNQSSFWAEEVELDFGKARIDFVGFKPFNILQLGMCSVSIDKGIFSFYEVKSCMADFKSGNGLTFLGDENYLVCERELADQLHKKMMLPAGVKVLVPNKPRTGLVTAFDLSNSYGVLSMRDKTSSELLWNMISARKSNRVDRNAEEGTLIMSRDNFVEVKQPENAEQVAKEAREMDEQTMSELKREMMDDVDAYFADKQDEAEA